MAACMLDTPCPRKGRIKQRNPNTETSHAEHHYFTCYFPVLCSYVDAPKKNAEKFS
jgi:hypothetical protein